MKTEQQKKVKMEIACDIFDYSVFQLNITGQSVQEPQYEATTEGAESCLHNWEEKET